ncbi:MAG: DegV family EDD domain-containing protein [Lachnospiraceae bacterium]|nr:DegV family EDD domain-containing protein [Lachnospiraceae bacterium]
MWKKIVQLVHGKDCELRERMLRTIILVGAIATLVAITEIFLVMDVNGALLTLLFMLLLVMGISFFATFKYQKYDFAAVLLGLLIILMVMPLMFFLSGAIESGASVWLALGILYTFVMFKGRKMIAFLFLSIFVYAWTYWTAYTYPEIIVSMPSREIAYFDAFFSVIAVGLVGGAILKAHMLSFDVEHQLNLQQKEELEKTQASKNAFFANMSHEIRTPINAIIGLNEMILRNNPTGETKEYAKDIQVASKMLLNQVNDILDFSQLEMNKMHIVPVKYETKELFRELSEIIRVQLEKKKLDFYLDMDPNLPSVLLGDEKRLKQVFLNILDNAVKYTEEGSVTLSVEREEYNQEEVTVKVKIADTGIGIRKEDMENIYDSFNRMDEKKNAQIAGSGLGLAITKQLVDLMEGEITIDSIYTKGTIFTVIVKQKIAEGKPIGEIDFQKKEDAFEGVYYVPSFEAAEARILVVDDNKMNSMVASKLLEATKVQVDVASSGTECLEMTRKKYYHVILLDYMMPGMNGTETLKAIRNQENGLCRDSAVITLTGNTLSGAKEMYIEEGFDGYVEKPIQGKLLEKEILQFIPDDIIEYQKYEKIEIEGGSQIQKITGKKKKKICITADCTCDLPEEMLEKYGIKIMYLYIKTPSGRFADTREIDSDSLTQYISKDSSSAVGDRVTVEEYEEFFAEVLTQAESVIHIALGSRLGRSHNTAVMAAQGFDHVHIVDSGQISGGQGLEILYAAKLAKEGKSVGEICDLVEKMAAKVRLKFIMPGIDIFYQNGRVNAAIAKFCKLLQLHPLAEMRQGKTNIVGMLSGNLENAWKKGIRWHLRKKRRIDKDIVVITHVGCSVKQQELIVKEVRKVIPFERVIVQKASFTNACNTGLESIGIAYYTINRSKDGDN